ncbi:putative helicase MOV-10 isoform X2 [Dendrobium catenatum]|uniref:Putative RNA helicase SDE3 n=1 Tax=Dendrobium catenatum TaxID=906689 RepID=A0A2I0WCE5_9ASPA|nr:putative helicase MOV-10 isoform X2 [Dendrobium catenatum]PKU73331.1 putative RNA helicase SDE3 [Dendrobium catenatum]
MFLLDALRCILCCCQDEQDQDLYSHRNNRDYTSLNPPILSSRSSSENHVYRDEARPPLPPACSIVSSRGNSKFLDETSSQGDGNRINFTNFYSPSFSSSGRDFSKPPALSGKPFSSPVSSTNSNVSVAGLSICPEKLQIKKISSTYAPETPNTASPLSKFPSSPISSSTSPSPLSQKPSFAPVSSANTNVSVTGLSIDPGRLQIMKGSARASQLSSVPSSTISSYAAPAPSAKKPSLASVSSTINTVSAVGPFGPEKLEISPERTDVATLLSKNGSLHTSSPTMNSISPAAQAKVCASKMPSLAPVSSTNSASSKAPVRVWQVKSLITPDSTTKLAEKPTSSSPSMPPSVLISTANNPVTWQKKNQTSIEPSREFIQNLPILSPSLIKVASPDSSSSSNSSSPSSLLECGISNRRVLPKYEIPKFLEKMIRNDIVPPVLTCPVSPSTYCDFFATLLYAEDYYIEKWNKYLLEGITLELRRRINPTNSQQRDFVAFKLVSVPEKRPYLLSRDFVFLKPLNEIAGPFKGRLFRVTKGIILVEFGEDFHSQHSPSKRYDVNFSFNRVCLKRAHHAISIASDPSFLSVLFPDLIVPSDPNTFHLHENELPFHDHAKRILNHKGPIPYLVNGQLVKEGRPPDEKLSFTGLIIQVALLSIYRTNPGCRILVCSPTNKTSDLLLRSLGKQIPLTSLFRANAAYRDYDLVPDDIIPASLYEEDEECFACPPLAELTTFSIITCTFMSSFRLYAAGIDTEHFTHIFLVDASLDTEPEAIVPLAHLASRNTAIVVTGCAYTYPSFVRADIARMHGLKKSYFHRLLSMEPYMRSDSNFISHLS